MKHKGILVVVSGFSGAGKGTLMKELLNRYDNYALSVSMTTRAPRKGEREGTEYFFVTREEFEDRIHRGQLVEYADYCGNYYGTPREYVDTKLQEGKDVILEIEIQGALKIKEQFPEALLLFVMPPDVRELKKRLKKRGTESNEIIDRRIKRAWEESKGIEQYDYIIINDTIEDCVARLHTVIGAARCQPVRNQEFIQNIKKELGEIPGISQV